MRRRTFTILSALSLLLCLAVGVVWVRSCFAVDWLELLLPGDVAWSVQWGDGQFGLTRIKGGRGGTTELAVSWNNMGHGRLLGVHTFWLRRGFDLDTSSRFGGINVPLWLPAAMTAVLPARWLWLRRQSRARRRAGLCAVCGYDLRASAGRCPECGAGLTPKLAPADHARL